MDSSMKAAKALEILKPNGGWVIYGDDFNTIIHDEGVTPVTKKQFDDAMKIAEQTFIAEAESKATAKAELLEQLGITEEQARLLLS